MSIHEAEFRDRLDTLKRTDPDAKYHCDMFPVEAKGLITYIEALKNIVRSQESELKEKDIEIRSLGEQLLDAESLIQDACAEDMFSAEKVCDEDFEDHAV